VIKLKNYEREKGIAPIQYFLSIAWDLNPSLPFGMYDNAFCSTRGSLIRQILPRVCHLSIINEKKKKKVMPLNAHYYI
jgi:hypothetical protein